ncbi:glutamine amidotransferase [Kaistia dalseonensis]|uniref:Membrane protein n=1 Tax=Kaistia dalseonensis TaxID=410840 RepID=A0ABU0HAQ9_9HYPH|nr:glutamine amidotransferase [Kaistia dalseonensis]MCX5496779.1 glutamine amidotransferase [Kaistia dalseonensis]MDQ0439404.1 putative membrane protein [Kaistia dalseonensis]
MSKKKVLLVGESWMSSATHYKGFDQFGSVTFHLGAEPLVKVLKDSPFELTYMPSHEAVTNLPFTLEGLAAYDAIILSDIGSNSILLHPDVWLHGKTVPNRIKLLRDYARAGGGLVMIGGYFTFQGIDGKGRWHKTAVEDALPVSCLPYDDRIEVPEGFQAEIVGDRTHPLLAGLDGEWPALLGANEVVLRERDDVVLHARLPESEGGHPLLVSGEFGEGRTVAWTSDIGPHWLPNSFVEWPGYATLWKNVLSWVTKAS